MVEAIQQVHTSRWNTFTPFITKSTISSFAWLRERWRSGVHTYSAFFCKSSQNGSIRADLVKAKLTCSTGPYQLLIPVISVGLGKSWMASSVSSLGLTPHYLVEFSAVNNFRINQIDLSKNRFLAWFWKVFTLQFILIWPTKGIVDTSSILWNYLFVPFLLLYK